MPQPGRERRAGVTEPTADGAYRGRRAAPYHRPYGYRHARHRRPAEDAVRAALATVNDPEIHRPITELGMVKSVEIGADGAVAVTVYLTVSGCPMRETITQRRDRRGRRRRRGHAVSRSRWT